MRFIGFILLLFVLFPSTSSAQYIYIKVTKTKSTNQLKSITSSLKSIGQSTTHRTTKTNFVIYSGPYKNNTSARYALKKVKRYFPYAKIVKTKTKPTSKKIAKRPSIYPSSTEPDYFIGGSLGYSSSSLTNSGSVELQYPPQETGVSYDLHLGYNFKKNMFVTVGYLISDMKDVVFDNFYGSINYKFKSFNNLTPYFGILAGYSKLTWNKAPIANATSANSASDSFFGGTQAGLIYSGYKTIALYTNYQCLFTNHSTAINVTDKLKYKTLHNIQIGVQYSF